MRVYNHPGYRYRANQATVLYLQPPTNSSLVNPVKKLYKPKIFPKISYFKHSCETSVATNTTSRYNRHIFACL